VSQETRKFEAEVAQVLHLVTHSLYSHKEIFLRELISNASDACDKLRFEAVGNPDLTSDDPELRIQITWDPEARTVSVRDNGIGMSKDEVVANIGTIASSGTRRYLEALSGEQKADARLIGQFGVGLLFRLRRGRQGHRHHPSRGRADRGRRALGKRWQGRIHARGHECHRARHHRRAAPEGRRRRVPEVLDAARGCDQVLRPRRLPDPHAGREGRQARSDEWQTINSASALWSRPKSEITDEEYQNFYKALGHDFNDALAWTHNRVEGSQSFTTLLYVPEQPPFDLMMGGREERKGLKLYIKRVFIMDAAEELLPNYLRFVRGVVDADDLPLNVSREILQQNRQLERIKAACTKRVLDLLEKVSRDEPEKFATFLAGFGNTLKEGIVEDTANRERIAKLLRFASTKGDGAAKTVSFDDYIGRMGEGQDTIWYVTADSYAAAAGSPQLEALKAKGIEVLLMSDRVDEWMLGYLTEYDGKRLRNVSKGEFPLDEADKAKQEAASAEAAPLIERTKSLLGDRVGDVRVSARLTDSPSCLALADFDLAPHLARLLREAGPGRAGIEGRARVESRASAGQAPRRRDRRCQGR
jgi:molecular chaperone HtpG